MPSKRKTVTPSGGDPPEPAVPKELLDHLVKGPMTQGELETMFRGLKKAVIERAMGAEMMEHLGYAPGQPKPEDQRNHRNGSSGKTVLTDDGPLRIGVPRDRDGSFEPQIVGKHERKRPFGDVLLGEHSRR
jgi:putative transposase